MPSPTLSMTGIANLRDIGGLRTADGRTVAAGLVFRSGHLGKATPDDLALLRRHGVRLVVDLRADVEAEDEGIGVPEGAERLSFGLPASPMYLQARDYLARGDYAGLLESFGAGGGAGSTTRHMADFYLEMTADEHGMFGAVLRRFAAADGTPALVHCSAGKDRTGWTIALLLLALGVSEEDIVAEYLLSDNAVDLSALDPRAAEVFGPAAGVRAEYLTGAPRACTARTAAATPTCATSPG
ncbi:tyrosine-protein phosphatase [Yinghuangia aomiensis]